MHQTLKTCYHLCIDLGLWDGDDGWSLKAWFCRNLLPLHYEFVTGVMASVEEMARQGIYAGGRESSC